MSTTSTKIQEAGGADNVGQLGFGTEFEAEAGAVSLNRKEASGAYSSAGTQCAIKMLYLENFKGFTRFKVELGRFNVLVGGNNSGKSTILRAARPAYELTKLHFHRHRGMYAEFYVGRSVPKAVKALYG